MLVALFSLALLSKPMLYLSEEAKLGIVSGAIAILILMVICMICKLSKLHKQPAYKDSSYLKQTNKTPPGKVPLAQYPSFAVDCSECEQEKLSKMKENVEQQTEQRSSPPRSKGTIKFSMIYQSNLHSLLLSIIEANQLVGKDFWDTVDSYVKLRLQPDNDGILRRQTKVVRNLKTLNTAKVMNLTCHYKTFKTRRFICLSGKLINIPGIT